MSLELDSRHLTVGSKFRYLLVAAAVDVSTIVPTWNEEKYLPHCLKSLRNQFGRRSSEIVVVDGGSTDRTVKIAEEYADKVLVNSRQPVGAARNAGAREASGRILAFIDADTVASETWLDAIDRTFELNPSAVGVTGPTLPYEGSMLDERVYSVATGWFQRFSLKLGLPHVAGFNCAYRKDAFWKAGGFDESRQLSEDIMLSLRIRHQGMISFNPELVAYTSLRRIKKYGYTYLTTYYLMNWATMLFLNRTLAYPKVR
jgi:glycosyltransferase involved in cell wall biosynthesis